MPFLRSGRPNVSRLARRGRVDDLREALRHDDAAVRAEAAAALAEFEGESVAGDLVGALRDPALDVRLAAMRSLETVGIHDSAQVGELVECMVARGEGAPELTAGALKLLVASVPEQCAEFFADRLLDPAAPPPDEGHRASLDLLLTTDARGPAAREAVVDMLIARLRPDGDEETEARIDTMLEWLGETAPEKVLGALENGTATPALLLAAGRLGNARAVTPTVQGLSSPDPEMREAAAHAARALNHTRAVPALLTATQDDVQAVRDAASAALDRMGTAAVIAGLAAVVDAQALLTPGSDEPPTPETLRTHVAEALEEGEPEGRPEEAPSAREAEPKPPAHPAHPAHPPRRRGGLIDRIFGSYE